MPKKFTILSTLTLLGASTLGAIAPAFADASAIYTMADVASYRAQYVAELEETCGAYSTDSTYNNCRNTVSNKYYREYTGLYSAATSVERMHASTVISAYNPYAGTMRFYIDSEHLRDKAATDYQNFVIFWVDNDYQYRYKLDNTFFRDEYLWKIADAAINGEEIPKGVHIMYNSAKGQDDWFTPGVEQRVVLSDDEEANFLTTNGKTGMFLMGYDSNDTQYLTADHSIGCYKLPTDSECQFQIHYTEGSSYASTGTAASKTPAEDLALIERREIIRAAKAVAKEAEEKAAAAELVAKTAEERAAAAEERANAAEAEAAAAKATAEAAKTTAETAQANAAAAQANAETAQANAEAAEAAAREAEAAALAAKAIAEATTANARAAEENANRALEQANTLAASAREAEAAAQQAEINAANAESAARAAEERANVAEARANQIAAESALEAQEAAKTAEEARQTAEEATKLAEEAQKAVLEAQKVAAEAQSAAAEIKQAADERDAKNALEIARLNQELTETSDAVMKTIEELSAKIANLSEELTARIAAINATSKEVQIIQTTAPAETNSEKAPVVNYITYTTSETAKNEPATEAAVIAESSQNVENTTTNNDNTEATDDNYVKLPMTDEKNDEHQFPWWLIAFGFSGIALILWWFIPSTHFNKKK